MKRSQIATVLATLSVLVLASCSDLSTTPPPPPVAIPKPVATPDIARTEAQVRAVEDKVDDVEDAVREVGNYLVAAKASATSIETAVEEAYTNGLEAGSKSADELREFVRGLQAELAKSVEAREAAMISLAETKGELDKTSEANSLLRTEIATMAAQNKELTGKLEEANVRIEVGIKIAEERDQARKDLSATEAKLKGARKYVWGVWIGIAILVAFFILKIAIATGKWTPQGRVARFFL